MGGASNTEGRVEICQRGVWGTVCNTMWDVNDASVVCRQLLLPFSGDFVFLAVAASAQHIFCCLL